MSVFQRFIEQMESDDNPDKGDWRRQYIQLRTGFTTPPDLTDLITAFVKSGDVVVLDDTTKPIKMPRKSLYLAGRAARSALLKRPVKLYEFVTNATPKQIRLILENSHIDWDHETEFGVYLNIPTTKGGTLPVLIETMRGASDELEDSLVADATRRWLTIDALYIEVTKPEGDNNKLYDPTGRGWHDINEGLVRKNSDESRQKDVIDSLSFGSRGQIDPETLPSIAKSVPMADLGALKSGFAQSLTNPDVDPEKFIDLCDRCGVLTRSLPGVAIDREFPEMLRGHRPLLMAWLLRKNSPSLVSYHLRDGWPEWVAPNVEAMLGLDHMHPSDDISRIAHRLSLAGVSPQQIAAWIRSSGTGRQDWASNASRVMGSLS